MSGADITSSQPRSRREIPEELKRKILARQGWRCAYCESDLLITGYHIDHKKPLCRGGTHHPNNLCGACPKCSQRKGGRMSAREYRAWLEECRDAPAGTWSCLNPGHQKYVGERWVPVAGFNKGDIWCRQCRSSYMKARWQRVGPIINAMQRERRKPDQLSAGRGQPALRGLRRNTERLPTRRQRQHPRLDEHYRQYQRPVKLRCLWHDHAHKRHERQPLSVQRPAVQPSYRLLQSAGDGGGLLMVEGFGERCGAAFAA